MLKKVRERRPQEDLQVEPDTEPNNEPVMLLNLTMSQ